MVAKRKQHPLETLDQFFTKEIRTTICEHIKKRINNFRENLTEDKLYGYMIGLTCTERFALLILIYAKGLLGQKFLDLKKFQ